MIKGILRHAKEGVDSFNMSVEALRLSFIYAQLTSKIITTIFELISHVEFEQE